MELRRFRFSVCENVDGLVGTCSCIVYYMITNEHDSTQRIFLVNGNGQ